MGLAIEWAGERDGDTRSPGVSWVFGVVLLVALFTVACSDGEVGDTTTISRDDGQATDEDTVPGDGESGPGREFVVPDLSAPVAQFPTDAGLVSVMDHGAAGDGVTDDTEAIRNAIRQSVGKARTLFFPAGTYLVTGTLAWLDEDAVWQPWLTFQGAGRDQTVIKLGDETDGFGDKDAPRPVVMTASGLFRGTATGGGKDHEGKGEGNEAFKNHIFDMTIDTGAGNEGAIGVDFLANNSGSLVNVAIRSSDGDGAVGLSLTRKWPGPALIKNVVIEGFDYGVKAEHTEYGITFENLILLEQRRAGILNDSNVLSIRNLTSRNTGPAIVNVSEPGLVVLVDSALGGGSADQGAIENEGHLYLRNVESYGYESLVSGDEGESVDEYISDSDFRDAFSSLGLPIEETPEQVSADLPEWTSVSDPGHAGGANPFDLEDDTAAIQTALDSGSSTVYFPSSGLQGEGRYLVSDTLVVPPSVERIVGFDSFIAPDQGNRFGDPSQPRAMLRVEEGEEDQILTLERFRFGRHNAEAPGVIWIEHDSSRTFVIKHVILGGGDYIGYRGLPGSGPLFLEDFCCSNMQFDNTSGVWARQLNTERSNKTKIENIGSDLWILGIKTENPSVVIETTQSGHTELLGGLLYPVREVPPDMPAFVAVDAEHSLVYAVSAYGSDLNHTIQVKETQNGQSRQLETREVLERNQGSVVYR